VPFNFISKNGLQPGDFVPAGSVNDNDLVIIVRGGNLSNPLVVYWKDLKSQLVASGAISVSEDGTIIVNQAANINFTGQGVTVTASGNSATVNIPGGGGSGVQLLTDGVENPNQAILNLIAGDYIDLTSDISGGVEIDVVGILSSDIITFDQGDPPVTISNQSDNHATQINMGTWDGLSTISIVYNTKTNPKDGAILEIEISDTFSTTATPVGPGVVDLEVKYGSTTIFNASVNADRAIRFRYEAAADVWFPISYVAVVAPPGSVQSVTGVNVDNTDPANPVVDTFSSFESYLTQGATSTITLDANSTPNHGIVIDFTVDPYTSLTVNSYPSPTDGALAIVRVNKAGGQLNVLGAFIAANATQPRTYISKYSTAASAWAPIASIPSNIVSSVAAVAPITVSGTNTATVSTSVTQNKLIGRGATSGTGVMQEITIGSGLSLSGTILSATGGGSITLETNGTPNGDQTLLNLVEGANMNITDDGFGNITFDATGGGLLSGNATQVSAGVYTSSITGVTAYSAGDAYLIKFGTANDGASTININALGAKNIFKNTNVPIASGDIKANQEIMIVYDGTNFQAIGLISSQLLAYVHNAEGAVINKGQVVYAYQASGNKMSVKLARANSDATSAKTIGLVYDSSIGIGGEGYIIIQGVIEGINTAAFTAGDTLYLSGSTFGGVTATKPQAPTHLVYVGIVERANAGNGQIYVRCQNGYELDEIHDVLITTPQTNQLLTYEATPTPLWKNKSLGTILGGNISQYVRGDGTLQTNAGSFGVTADGVGGVVQVGNVGYVVMTYAGTIVEWYLTADVSGTVSFDITKSTGVIPTIPTVSIIGVGGIYPTLTSQQIATGTNFTNWTSTTFVAGDIFGFIIRSSPAPVSIKNVTLSLRVTKS
jgi:hypothetical protein